jgi:N-carbamoyl-L-amino-acid hydrolase
MPGRRTSPGCTRPWTRCWPPRATRRRRTPWTWTRALRDRLARALAARGIGAPVLATGAGHDAGVLSARVPAGMLFVRNPSGVSHSPAEHAEQADCLAGAAALTAVLEDLACR